MKRYYYSCPRGFSNEFIMISVEQNSERERALEARLLEIYRKSNNINWDLHRVTAKEAQKIIRNERATERSYRRAGLNTVNNPVGATEIMTITEFYEEW